MNFEELSNVANSRTKLTFAMYTIFRNTIGSMYFVKRSYISPAVANPILDKTFYHESSNLTLLRQYLIDHYDVEAVPRHPDEAECIVENFV